MGEARPLVLVAVPVPLSPDSFVTVTVEDWGKARMVKPVRVPGVSKLKVNVSPVLTWKSLFPATADSPIVSIPVPPLVL